MCGVCFIWVLWSIPRSDWKISKKKIKYFSFYRIIYQLINSWTMPCLETRASIFISMNIIFMSIKRLFVLNLHIVMLFTMTSYIQKRCQYEKFSHFHFMSLRMNEKKQKKVNEWWKMWKQYKYKWMTMLKGRKQIIKYWAQRTSLLLLSHIRRRTFFCFVIFAIKLLFCFSFVNGKDLILIYSMINFFSFYLCSLDSTEPS